MSQSTVAAVRAKYPTPLADTHATFLLEVAAALGLGLVSKTQGTRITLPSGQEVSQDVVMSADGDAWDILSDGEGAATPVFNQIDPIDIARYIAVPSTGHTEESPVDPPVDPPTPAPTVDLQPVLLGIDQLKSMVTASVNFENFTGTQLSDLNTRIENLEAVVLALFQREFPAYTGRLSFTGAMRFTPEVKKS